MTDDTFIPVGRTSLVRKGAVAIQVQTEYASRPYPRLTTTVLNSGQVVHKIDRKLKQVVTSLTAQREVEAAIARQHQETLSLIQAVPTAETAPDRQHQDQSVYDRLVSIPGFKHVYRLTVEGTFVSTNTTEQFKREFGTAHANLSAIVDIFPLTPGQTDTRQEGVCEIETSRLYYVSAGRECYFVAFAPTGESIDYEKILRHLLIEPDPFFDSRTGQKSDLPENAGS